MIAWAVRELSTKRLAAAGTAILLPANLAACSSMGSDAAFPEHEIRIIVPSDAGGGFDTTARQIQPFVAEELGETVVVENIPGGNYSLGAVAMMQADDCYTVGIQATPLLQISYMTQEVPYTSDDFYPIAGLTREPSVVRVRPDAPWEDFSELIEDALDRPGEIKISTTGATDTHTLAVEQLMQVTGAEFNLIPYEGGTESRLALVNGEVDINVSGVFDSLPIAEETRAIGIFQSENNYPSLTNDAKPISQQLGVKTPEAEVTYDIITSESCHGEHPERYQALVDAFAQAGKDSEYLTVLKEASMAGKLNYVEPDALKARWDQLASTLPDELASLE